MMNQRRLCVHGDKCSPTTFKQLLNCRVLHHHKFTIEQIAERCAIKLARLRKYIADSEPDQIPYLALLRIADFLDAWDLVDFSLQQYRRRTASIDSGPASANPLSEAVDVTVHVGQLLEEVRAAVVSGGIDEHEATRINAMTRQVRRDVDEVDSAVAAARGGAQ